MISLSVHFFGPIRRPWPEMERTISLSEPMTLNLLLEHLGFRNHEQRYISIHVNGESRPPQTLLSNGDEISLRLLIGGG